MLIIFPINLFAYSENIILGGKNIGIEIESEGLVVVGFYKVNDKYIGSENLKIGDVLLEVEGVSVNSIDELSKILDDNVEKKDVNIKIKRSDKIINTKLTLVKEGDIYKTGLYVKEKVTGIGTLTYIDPETRIYGALGHSIILNETNTKVEVKNGKIYSSYVNGIDRSIDGQVGSKNATILYNQILGSIKENDEVGIYGTYDEEINKDELIPVAKWSDIHKGDASIYTITESDTVSEYKINITKINKDLIDTNKSISFEVIDENLIEKSGGIVQGMSGSPIVQDGKIIGAVTHVLVDDVTRGYAVFIRTMLEEGEN